MPGAHRGPGEIDYRSRRHERRGKCGRWHFTIGCIAQGGTYNARSELLTAKRYYDTNTNGTSNPMTGRQYTYAFDPIGNRDSYQIDANSATTYVDNVLNQYDRTTNGTTYESFGYDADGTTTYEWDAENRLAAQYPTNHSANKIVWTYDYMNRRVWRRGYAWDANLNQYKSGTDTVFERKFLFDGWNNLMILDGKAGDVRDDTGCSGVRHAPPASVDRVIMRGGECSGCGGMANRGPFITPSCRSTP